MSDQKTTLDTAGGFSRLNRCCAKCDRILIQGGVHMGIPFAHWTQRLPEDGYRKLVVCGKCYDLITVKDNIQRTGDQTI